MADIKNLGGEFAGAITAALFLAEWVGDTPWAHLDIAGTMRSDADDAWRTKGATGFGARLLVEIASTFAGRPGDGDVIERRAIHESIAGAAVLGTLAVVWGIAAQSRVLLFDGAFILLGIVLSALSLMASRAAAESPTTRFPFGKAAVTPLAIAVQGVALLGTLLYAAVDAVAIITAGGSDVAAGTVVAYGLITMTCSYALSRWLTHRAPTSELVAAEVAQWRAGALLSLVFAVGAGLALALSSVGDVVRYVDPVLVLVACLVLAPIPLRLLRAAGLELLEAAPPPLVQDTLDAAVASVRASSWRAWCWRPSRCGSCGPPGSSCWRRSRRPTSDELWPRP